jgi:hypothetical protein
MTALALVPLRRHTWRVNREWFEMRAVAALFAVGVLAAGCSDHIPLKSDFGVTAATVKSEIPPEFAAFNNYDPAVAPLLANQICATPYQLIEQKGLPAVPGDLAAWRGRCAPYRITPANLAEHFTP